MFFFSSVFRVSQCSQNQTCFGMCSHRPQACCATGGAHIEYFWNRFHNKLENYFSTHKLFIFISLNSFQDNTFLQSSGSCCTLALYWCRNNLVNRNPSDIIYLHSYRNTYTCVVDAVCRTALVPLQVLRFFYDNDEMMSNDCRQTRQLACV